jgi:hypothetical protein
MRLRQYLAQYLGTLLIKTLQFIQVLKRFVDLKILNLFPNSDLELDQFYLVISRKTQKHFGLFSEKHNTVLTFKTILKDY